MKRSSNSEISFKSLAQVFLWWWLQYYLHWQRPCLPLWLCQMHIVGWKRQSNTFWEKPAALRQVRTEWEILSPVTKGLDHGCTGWKFSMFLSNWTQGHTQTSTTPESDIKNPDHQSIHLEQNCLSPWVNLGRVMLTRRLSEGHEIRSLCLTWISATRCLHAQARALGLWFRTLVFWTGLEMDSPSLPSLTTLLLTFLLT